MRTLTGFRQPAVPIKCYSAGYAGIGITSLALWSGPATRRTVR
ncbi:hypothetical protein ACNTMW_05475 [Planosporangium sp. 12N6]